MYASDLQSPIRLINIGINTGINTGINMGNWYNTLRRRKKTHKVIGPSMRAHNESPLNHQFHVENLTQRCKGNTLCTRSRNLITCGYE
jgi:hypothetical protein